jgi:hypothetical protein
MRLELPEDDPKSSTAHDDLTRMRPNDAKRPQRPHELRRIARSRLLRQRPRHLGERDAQRVSRAFGRQPRRDRALRRATGERERD